MSLDNFSECSSCKANTAANVWVSVYSSLAHAKAQGGPDFLSVMVPGPCFLKIEVCFSCMRFAPAAKYTSEELAALKENQERQGKASEMGEKLGKLFGFLK